MNKRNKILVGCLALLLVLSVGYALFSETITINGTATGNCTINGQIITTASNLTKPSESVTYTITLTNNGSIPAKLKTITSPNNYSGDGDQLSSTNAIMYFDMTNLLWAYYEFEGVEWESNNYDSDVVAANIVLQPNDTKTITINHSWVDSEMLGDRVVQPAVPANGVTLDYDITLGFEQITN